MQNLIRIYLILAMGLISPFASSEEKPHVDLLLVIAVDTSASVDHEEYKLQTMGVVKALEDRDIAYLLETCNRSGAAITYAEWAGENFMSEYKQLVEWQRVGSGSDLKNLANDIRKKTQEKKFEGQTDILSAIRFSADLISTAPFQSFRRLINISSDGIQNVRDRLLIETAGYGDDFTRAHYLRDGRDRLVDQGFVIDALVITNDEAKIGMPMEHYFNDNVKGGPASFVSAVSNYQDYALAFKKMLLRELNDCGS